ncbi:MULTISPECIES: tetratricopeptide repeat protein [unclassified Shewanella]|uniref:tetratricopeptide repeat protein n=1 Tax=unclassified Shewanella TaxID=196818 RepID=UPI001785C966|nr:MULTISPECIES: tetratricopeptide repeat protein [unclassified Shewanella]MBQ4892066.1 nitrite reductase [Shewanella sp. MMG014]
MNSLLIAIIGTLCFFITIVWRSVQYVTPKMQGSSESSVPLAKQDDKVLFVVCLIILLVPIAIYSQLGRFNDWNTGYVAEHIDYLIAADINKNARAVNIDPNNRLALINLANAYAEGGMYDKSVQTLNELLEIKTDAEVLGMKANALYYRDGRDMSLEVTIVLSQALAIDPNEVQSLLLIATDAFLNKDFQKAIEHWHQLLDSNNLSVNRTSIKNAISRAEQEIANQAVTASE